MHSSVVVAATKGVKNETSTSEENSSESDNDLDLDTLHSYPIKKLIDYCKAEEIVVKGKKKIDYIRAIKEYNQVSDSSESDSTSSDDDSLFLNFNNIKNKSSSSKSGPKLDNFNYFPSFTSHQSSRYPYSSHTPVGISEDEMIRLALEESLRSSQEIKPTQTQSAPATPAPKKKEKLKKPEIKKDINNNNNNRKKRSPKSKKSFNFSTLQNPTEPSTTTKPKKKNVKKKKQNFKQLSASNPSKLRIEDDDSDEDEMLKRAIAESLKLDTTSETSPSSETKSTTSNTSTTSSGSSSVPSPRHIDADAALALSLHLEQQKELKKERKRQRKARVAYNAEINRNSRSNSTSNNNLNHFGSSNGYASREASLAALQDFFSRMGGNVHGAPMYIPPIASNMHNNRSGGRNRYRGRYIDPDNMTYEELLELEDQIGEVKKKGIDEKVIAANTQIFVFSKKVESNFDDCEDDHVEKNVGPKEITNTKYNTCSVCLMDFDDGDTLRALPCVHCYHKDCIDRWLQEKGKCPVCQMDVGTS